VVTPGSPHVVPILLTLCAAIDGLFIETVGPFGALVVKEARATWLAGGHRIRTSDIESYIALLAREIPDADERKQFAAGAHELVGKY
jgi:hypothetical protein